MQAVANAVKECFGWNEATAKPVNTYHTACIMVVYRGDESLYLAAFFLFLPSCVDMKKVHQLSGVC